jgi:phosphoribosylpyrophosphate synthetase
MIVGEGCAECGYRVLDRLSGGDVAAQLNACLVELLALTDTWRRAGASRSTAIAPFLGDGRSDSRPGIPAAAPDGSRMERLRHEHK